MLHYISSKLFIIFFLASYNAVQNDNNCQGYQRLLFIYNKTSIILRPFRTQF